jgi:hypothetical protein
VRRQPVPNDTCAWRDVRWGTLEIALIALSSGILNVTAFHEKAGRSQVDSFFAS